MKSNPRTINRLRPRREENANAISHGIMFVCFLVALPFLVMKGNDHGTGGVIVSLVFGISLLFTFLTSSIYHLLILGKYKEKAKMADHLSIFFLIAGTNTPLVYIFMNNRFGMGYLVALWSLVVLGVILKVLFINKLPKFLTYYYVFMGWFALIVLAVMWTSIPNSVLTLVLLGGLSYSIGVYFYMRDHRPWRHLVWHFLVMGGAITHFIAIWLSFELS